MTQPLLESILADRETVAIAAQPAPNQTYQPAVVGWLFTDRPRPFNWRSFLSNLSDILPISNSALRVQIEAGLKTFPSTTHVTVMRNSDGYHAIWYVMPDPNSRSKKLIERQPVQVGYR